MLSTFTMERHYSGVDVRLYVDVKRGEAEATIAHKGRLAGAPYSVPFGTVSDPAKAGAWFRHDCGELGGFMERLAWEARHGVGVFAPRLAA